MKLPTIKMGLLFCMIAVQALGQSQKPDLQNPDNWKLVNREADTLGVGFNRGIRLVKKDSSGLMILKNSYFAAGALEFDVKGINKPQESFVGLAFHVQNDSTYDAVYFRPFNFKNKETARRSRSIQYISLPAHDWPELRENSPGKYESRVDPIPDPDGWFHVKIVLAVENVSVFVNHSPQASLVVKRLSTHKTGGVALWTGNGSDGSFANLVMTPANSR